MILTRKNGTWSAVMGARVPTRTRGRGAVTYQVTPAVGRDCDLAGGRDSAYDPAVVTRCEITYRDLRDPEAVRGPGSCERWSRCSSWGPAPARMPGPVRVRAAGAKPPHPSPVIRVALSKSHYPSRFIRVALSESRRPPRSVVRGGGGWRGGMRFIRVALSESPTWIKSESSGAAGAGGEGCAAGGGDGGRGVRGGIEVAVNAHLRRRWLA